MTKILVIEDERATRTNIINFLEAEGFDTLVAENGRLGIQLAQSHLPDLIICDILMPELDGYDVLTTLQEETQTASIPFIFLTVTATEAGFQQSLDLGADDYLSKPITSEQLRKAIAVQLQKQAEQLDYPETDMATDSLSQPASPELQLLKAKDQLFNQLAQGVKPHLAKISRAAQALKQKTAREANREANNREASHETHQHLQELQEGTARVLALVNEITALHNMLTPENADLLLEQFNLADESERHSL
ncbi:MAG: response regulator [Pegethrix bostrychoides GSE-TBD4-15B]|jgi:CheY-like chemotaxis protein|uniref:Response regulator n=1 Tax=Pegethrix bostrychoides GSE-TBD4-15B TaxID=2839662 RepID=A0A951U5B8_9CYAN|nr:response regulator [Pegethrix bostrychoides GSE-TBD4-15B]